ncbi:MoaD/ThiS family protein [Gandjariella thermophila]|uniref:Molybdopterin synthase sulfur carrier subunit n=1 Tax=Gandjariella thermophila TaxID=1931992 RepID=A0A4D4J402_9PSEU|nr:MoaD/ThiS family protein [Gandjariella thermophila]GDY30194.1 molybdopterin synthase sulfur carrier subunit [Gandjariella thermophila]
MPRLTVRYFAGARAAAGVPEEKVELPDPATVRDVVAFVEHQHGDRLAKVLTACSFLLDGMAVRDLHAQVPEDAELDVLPPFAGG